jgi:hypothetical protein
MTLAVQKRRGTMQAYSLNESEESKNVRIQYEVDEELRNKSDTVRLGELAANAGIPDFDILGVRSVSPLVNLLTFDYIRQTPPCFLHQFSQGVAKWLVQQLLLPPSLKPDSNCHNPSLHQQRDRISTRLSELKTPASIQRAPQSLSELAGFKGHEYEVLLLASLPIVLHNIIGNEYYAHLLVLSSAVFWLCLDGAPLVQVEKAETSLKVFGAHLLRLYGPTAMTYNAHHLCNHFVATCLASGPLARASSGVFESAHTRLKTAIHGKKNTDVELARTLSEKTIVQQLCQEITLLSNRKLSQKNAVKCADDTIVYHPIKGRDNWYQFAILPNGMRLEAFNISKKKQLSCFVATMSEIQSGEFQFYRINRIFIADGVLAVECVQLHTEEDLLLQSNIIRSLEPRLCGCDLQHVRRLACNPFSQMASSEIRRGAHFSCSCIVNDAFIAAYPQVQFGIS